jgi:hypothetical protein
MSSVNSKKGQDGCCLTCGFDCVKEGRYSCHNEPCFTCDEDCKHSSVRFNREMVVPLK